MSQNHLWQKREKEKIDYVQEINSILQDNPRSVKTVDRLGKVRRETGNVSTTNRPIKVVFDD